MTSVIVFPYIREQTINDIATMKNMEGVFTLISPRSSALVTDRGTPAAIGSRGRGHGASDQVASVLATPRLGLKRHVQVRDCAQPCHSADVYRREGVLKWLE